MRKAIGLIFVLCLPIQADEIKKGEVIGVNVCTWVKVANPHGIRSQGSFFKNGDSVIIKREGRVKVSKIEGNSVLLKYYIKGWQYGSCAPSRTRFYMTRDDVLKMKYDITAIY